MRGHTRELLGLAFGVAALVALGGPARATEPTGQEAGCDRVEGTVEHGEAYRALLPSGYELLLEPASHPANPQGWTIRVFLPPDEERDLSVYATPPFRFSNPRYLDTGYGHTAAQAVAWSERRFHFATGPADHDVLATAVVALLWPYDYAEETLEQARRAIDSVPVGSGRLRVLDARLREPDDQFPLGLIEQLHFEAELCPPAGEPE